ncbi:NADH:flavin oxidoreductase/NADH oxidase [Purpureocillium lavendulum]|uniref:NADH:flavin oxidoreductase/NADH oxidase n=1 Tax=Purpureocillium lavendulum TaxID=1247861 RepID=A0AB34G0A7_9HYPO|nr:NADH:flavin oxidoreductase/NADH oxidase [Purpureocillium lavendulum]
MHGFEWQDLRGAEDLERIINDTLAQELSSLDADGYAHVKLFPLMKRLVTKVNCVIFFGEELSRNTEFTDAALEFPQAVIFAAEFLRITPGFLRPFVASAATGRHRAAKTLHKYLVPIVEQRLAIRGVPGVEVPTTTYAIEDLCLHPEHIAPLREEAEELFLAEDSARDVNRLAFLDSFIKESIRCTNSDAITCRRKALVSYTFKDGSIINKGDWVCVPQRAMMQDSTRYRDPQTFDGFRFARANAQFRHQQQQPYSADVPDRKESNLTDASAEWPIWGFGNTACPGRFYANLVTKLVMIRILNEWECKMHNPAALRSRRATEL